MTPREAVALVATVRAGCPGMEIVEGMPQLWHQVLGDLRIEDCQSAVVVLVRRSARYIAPAHIRDEVARIRAERLDATPLPQPPAELPDHPSAYRDWYRQTQKQIADGTYVPGPPLELVRAVPELPQFPSPDGAA